MPNAIFQLDTNQVLNDFEARIRRLESYSPATINTSLFLNVATANGTPASAMGLTAGSWTTAHSLGFTLTAQQTVLCIVPLSWVGNGGTANYVNARLAVDGNAYGAQYSQTNGSGYASATLVLSAPHLAAGSHTLTVDYTLNAGSGTTVTENHATWNVQMDVWNIGA